MNFTVNVAEFTKLFKPAFDCASTKTLKEFLYQDMITFTSLEKGLKAISNNGTSAVAMIQEKSKDFNWKFNQEGTFTVKASELLDVVSSFPQEKHLDFKIEDGTLKIELSEDAEEFQYIALLKEDVNLPISSETKFNKPLEIDKKNLSEAIHSVFYSIGFRFFEPIWLHLVVRCNEKGFRVGAGDGARFAFDSLSGPEMIKNVSKDDNLFIHKNQVTVLQKILEWSKVSFIQLQQNNVKSGQSNLMMKFDNLVLILFGQDVETKWPDENIFLNRKNAYKLSIAIKDFDWALKGLFASQTDDNSKHKAVMSFDLDKKVLFIKSSSGKSNRKVNISEVKSEGQNNVITHECIAHQLSDAIKNAKGEYLQFEFAEMQEKKKPCIVRCSDTKEIQDRPVFQNKIANTEEMYELVIAHSNE